MPHSSRLATPDLAKSSRPSCQRADKNRKTRWSPALLALFAATTSLPLTVFQMTYDERDF